MKFKVGDRVRHKTLGLGFIETEHAPNGEFNGYSFKPDGIERNTIFSLERELIEEECELKTGDKAMFWDCEGDTKEEKIFIAKDDNKEFPFIAVSSGNLEYYKGGISFCCDLHVYCEPIKEVTKEDALEAMDWLIEYQNKLVGRVEKEHKVRQYILNN